MEMDVDADAGEDSAEEGEPPEEVDEDIETDPGSLELLCQNGDSIMTSCYIARCGANSRWCQCFANAEPDEQVQGCGEQGTGSQ